MNKEELNIIKIKIKLSYIKKQEIKTQIIKSIFKSKKITPTTRVYAHYLLNKRKINKYKYKHICLKNKKKASVFNKLFLSKYSIKNLIIENKIQNLKLDTW